MAFTTDIEPTEADLLVYNDEKVRRVTLAWLIGQRSPNTRDAYRRALKKWTTWCTDNGVDPINPERAQVQVWIAACTANGNKPATVRSQHAAIKSWHAELAIEGCRPLADPHYKLRLPTLTSEPAHRLLSDGEVRKLILAARTLPTPAETCVTMMATMGLRAGETGTVHEGMLEQSPFGPVLRIVGKGNKPALIPVPRVVLAAAARCHWPAWDRKPVPNAHAWGSEAVYRRVSRWCARPAALAGIEDFSPHMLRHYFVSRALTLGVAERDVQLSARHASFDTTAMYARALDRLANHATFAVASLYEDLS